MRTLEEYKSILELREQGYNYSAIARKTKIPRETVRDCVKTYENVEKLLSDYNDPTRSMRMYKTNKNRDTINSMKNPLDGKDELFRERYAYLLGIFLGDGCLSKDKKNVYRIRVSCDAKYTGIIQKIQSTIEHILPNNKVGLVIHEMNKGIPSCIDVCCYSKDWVLLFPFYKPGRKHTYKIQLEEWQERIIKDYPKEFWLGLFHSDGSRYISTQKPCKKHSNIYSHTCYNFTQKSKDIMNLFIWCSGLLGLETKARMRSDGSCYVVSIYKQKYVAFLDTFAGAKT